MGSTASKPAANGASYEWKGSSPISASQDLVNSIQSNKETDASRAKLMEIHVETRVAEQLQKLHDNEAAALKEAREKLSLGDVTTDETLTSHKVSSEVEALRARLEGRKKIKDLPEGVETARSNVIKCLRDNDRKPLNCWSEVEAFKEEVRKLEKGWVEKASS